MGNADFCLRINIQGVPHLRGFHYHGSHYCGFWLMYVQVGDFHVSWRPPAVPLMRSSCNVIFFKSQIRRGPSVPPKKLSNVENWCKKLNIILVIKWCKNWCYQLFDTSRIQYFSKFNNFLFNFVLPSWKLENPNYHIGCYKYVQVLKQFATEGSISYLISIWFFQIRPFKKKLPQKSKLKAIILRNHKISDNFVVWARSCIFFPLLNR